MKPQPHGGYFFNILASIPLAEERGRKPPPARSPQIGRLGIDPGLCVRGVYSLENDFHSTQHPTAVRSTRGLGASSGRGSGVGGGGGSQIKIISAPLSPSIAPDLPLPKAEAWK